MGICGVAMGTLACMLKKSGYRVTGSDAGIYPPMSDILAAEKIPVAGGFEPRNLEGADLVIVGNAMTRGNPEVEALLNSHREYCSMAAAIHRFFLQGKEVIAVAGTHGKTTTTALLSHILVTAGEDPSCLIGGVSKNLGANYRLGRGKYFVIEADEYDSAFFEKVPKFIFYRPRHLVLTSLEFDHADIYENLNEIERWFRCLIRLLPSQGTLVYNRRSDLLAELAVEAPSRVYGYGTEESSTRASFLRYEAGKVINMLEDSGTGSGELPSQIIGEFNLQNMAAAAAMALRLGISRDAVIRGIETFEGVRRRQEIIYEAEDLTVYEDFAHHPTAIAGVLGAFRHRHPGARIFALYEPRSATSRRNVFQEELPGAFEAADRVMIKNPFKLEGISDEERIDITAVIEALSRQGKEAGLFFEVETMIEELIEEVEAPGEKVVVLMSNGGFDGIYNKLAERLETLFQSGG